jgi:hypothetical protein
MVKPVYRVSEKAGKADAKKTATKTTQEIRVSQTIEGLQKNKTSRKADAKDNKTMAPTKSFPKSQRLPQYRAEQAHIATAPKSDARKAPVDELDSHHRAVAATPIDRATKIHFKATSGPPSSPTYFISERRTYAQRVEKQIEEAEERDKPRYSKKAPKEASYIPSTEFPQQTIRLSPDYWNTRCVQ